jgi:KDO2-lipid IV(A) lauroyltransferase
MNRKELTKIDKRFHENTFKQIINHILVGLLIAVSWLPFWILYRLSDALYIIIRFVIKYRFKVITENLNYAFPEKTENEISEIRNKFYRHFCDLVFESVKLHSINEKEIAKRVITKGTEILNSFYDSGRSIIGLTIHHNNWEWSGIAQSKLKHLILPVYNPVRGNSALENFLVQNRERWGSKCIPVHKTLLYTAGYQSQGLLTGLYLIADQTPPANSKFWTFFLNREAPFFSGPEKIAAKYNQPVFFLHIKKTGRGKYSFELELLFENPKEVEQKEILLAYVRRAEEIIRQEPEYYLWSHRRWKHKRPEDIPLTL